jgi:lysophospholipase L1-like esterase
MRTALLFLLLAALSACSRPAGTTAPAPTSPAPAATVRATTTPSPSPTPAVRYVAIGASDTVGVGASDPATGSWPAIALQAKDQQLPGAIAQHPTVVTIWLAVNDMNATIEPASYREALAAIVDALVGSTEAKVFVGNVPDVRGVPAYRDADKTALAQAIGGYNTVIASVVDAHPGRAFLVDLYTGSAALVSTITVSADGFHPSDDGYQLIARRFADAMRANGVPLASP